MSMQQAQRQMPASSGRVTVADGEAVRATISDEACGPRHGIGNAGSALLLAALTRENLQQAFKRVRANKGAAGVDGLDINQTAQHLVTAWPAIREQLLSGTYRLSPILGLSQANISMPKKNRRAISSSGGLNIQNSGKVPVQRKIASVPETVQSALE